jgi:hypothetical protein
MTQYKAILSWMIFAAATSSASAAAGHYAISTDEIAATMGRFGMQIAPAQVTLLSVVVATNPAPRLTVRSIQPWGSQRMMARLECESKEQCLPFFVGLQMADGSDAQSGGGSSRPATSPIPSSMTSSRNYVVRSGAPATLQLDSERVHIRISVICLENGAAGQTIRVTGKDHRLVYSARVIDGGHLQGSL